MTLDLGLVGHTLDSVDFGHAVQLHFGTERELLVENSVMVDVDGARETVPPDDGYSDAVQALVGRTVTAAAADESGALRIAFGEGAELVVAAGPDYESWTVTGPSGFRVVCLPGGELAVWGSAPAPDAVYFGLVPPGRTRANPAGVVRRIVVDGVPRDEAFTRGLRWEPSTALYARDFGHSDTDYVAITPEEAHAFVDRIMAGQAKCSMTAASCSKGASPVKRHQHAPLSRRTCPAGAQRACAGPRRATSAGPSRTA